MNRPGCRSCCNPVPQAPHGCFKLIGEDSFRASDGTWRTGEEYIDYIIEEKMVTSGFPSFDAHKKSIVKQDDHEYKARFSCYKPTFLPTGPTQTSSGNYLDEIMVGNDAWGPIWPKSWTATFGFSDVIIKSYLEMEVETSKRPSHVGQVTDATNDGDTLLEEQLLWELENDPGGSNLRTSVQVHLDDSDWNYWPPIDQRDITDVPCKWESQGGSEIPGSAIGIGPNKKCYYPDTYRGKPHPDKPKAFLEFPWFRTEIDVEEHYVVSYREVYIDDELVYTSKQKYLYKKSETQRGYKPPLPDLYKCPNGGYPEVGCFKSNFTRNYKATFRSQYPPEEGCAVSDGPPILVREGSTGLAEQDMFTITNNYPENLNALAGHVPNTFHPTGSTLDGFGRPAEGIDVFLGVVRNTRQTEVDHYSNFGFCLSKNYIMLNDITLNYSIPSQAFQYATIESNDFIILNPFTGSLGRSVDPDTLPPNYHQTTIGLETAKSVQEKMLNADFDRLGITVDEANLGSIESSADILARLGIVNKYVCVTPPGTGWRSCHFEFQDANGDVVPDEEVWRFLDVRSKNKKIRKKTERVREYDREKGRWVTRTIPGETTHVTVPVYESMIPLDEEDVQRAIDALGDAPEEFIDGEPNPAYEEWVDEVNEIRYINDEKKRIYRRALTLNFNVMNYYGNWVQIGLGDGAAEYAKASVDDEDSYNKPIDNYTLTGGYIRLSNGYYFKLADFFTSFVSGKVQLAYTDNFPAVDGGQFLLSPNAEDAEKLFHGALANHSNYRNLIWQQDTINTGNLVPHSLAHAPQKVVYASGEGGKLMVGEEVFHPSGSAVVWIIVQVNKAGPNGDTTYWLRKKSNPEQIVLASEHDLDFREKGNKRYYWSTLGVINLQTTYLEDEFADPFLYKVVGISFHNGGSARVPLTVTGEFRFVDGIMEKHGQRSNEYKVFNPETQEFEKQRNVQAYSWNSEDFDKQPWHDYITLVSLYGAHFYPNEEEGFDSGNPVGYQIHGSSVRRRYSPVTCDPHLKFDKLSPKANIWFTPLGRPSFPYPKSSISSGGLAAGRIGGTSGYDWFDYEYNLNVSSSPPKNEPIQSNIDNWNIRKGLPWDYEPISISDQAEASKYNVVTQTPQYFQISDDSYLEFILEPVIGGQGAINEMRQLGFDMDPPEAIKGDGNPPALKDNLANPFLAAKFNPVNPQLDPNAAAQQGNRVLQAAFIGSQEEGNKGLKYFNYPIDFLNDPYFGYSMTFGGGHYARPAERSLRYGYKVAYPDERVKKITQKEALKRNWRSVEAKNEVVFDDYTETLGSNCIIVTDEPSEIWESVPANIKVLEDADLAELITNGLDGGCAASNKKLDYSDLMDRLQEEYDKNTESFPDLNEDNNIDIGTECYVGFPCFWSKTAQAVEPYPEGLYGINKPYEELPQVLDYRYFAYAEFRGKLYPVMKGIIVKVVKIMTDEELPEDPSINELLNTMSLTNGPKHVIEFSRAEDYGWGETMDTLWTSNRNLLPDTYEGDRKSYINFYTEYPGGGFMHIPAGAASAQLFPVNSCKILNPKDEL